MIVTCLNNFKQYQIALQQSRIHLGGTKLVLSVWTHTSWVMLSEWLEQRHTVARCACMAHEWFFGCGKVNGERFVSQDLTKWFSEANPCERMTDWTHTYILLEWWANLKDVWHCMIGKAETNCTSEDALQYVRISCHVITLYPVSRGIVNDLPTQTNKIK